MARSATRFERPAQHAGRPRATKPRAERETRPVLCHSVVVDSAFKQSENVAIAVVSTQRKIFSDDHFIMRAWICNSYRARVNNRHESTARFERPAEQVLALATEPQAKQ